MMQRDLFDSVYAAGTEEPLGAGAVVLRGFAIADERMLLAALERVIAEAPLRHMVTPGGYRMSVASHP